MTHDISIRVFTSVKLRMTYPYMSSQVSSYVCALSAPNGLMGTLTNAPNGLMGTLTNTPNGLMGTLTNAPNGLMGTLTNAPNGLMGTLTNAPKAYAVSCPLQTCVTFLFQVLHTGLSELYTQLSRSQWLPGNSHNPANRPLPSARCTSK